MGFRVKNMGMFLVDNGLHHHHVGVDVTLPWKKQTIQEMRELQQRGLALVDW